MSALVVCRTAVAMLVSPEMVLTHAGDCREYPSTCLVSFEPRIRTPTVKARYCWLQRLDGRVIGAADAESSRCGASAQEASCDGDVAIAVSQMQSGSWARSRARRSHFRSEECAVPTSAISELRSSLCAGLAPVCRRSTRVFRHPPNHSAGRTSGEVPWLRRTVAIKEKARRSCAGE